MMQSLVTTKSKPQSSHRLDKNLSTALDYDKLNNVKWDFSKRNKSNSIDSIHPYPAKFISEIPAAIIDNLPIQDGSYVLDPFAGSGTTLVECQRYGIPSIGVDLNPIACLITRVKTSPLPYKTKEVLNDILSYSFKKNIAIPSIPNLSHWFKKETQEVISNLANAILLTDKQYHDLFRLALSSILVRVSNQESDTRYAAIEKNIGPQEIINLYSKSVQKIVKALTEREYQLCPAKIIHHNTLTLDPKAIGSNIGAIITSPPYPNAYEYWLYHKYRMYWLGFDPIAVKNEEIGARAHFFKKNPHTEHNFNEQMDQTFALINEVLLPNGYAAFVVGRSKIHGKIIDNAKIIEESAEKFGFKKRFKIERTIAASRKSFNLSHANIKTETLLVVSK